MKAATPSQPAFFFLFFFGGEGGGEKQSGLKVPRPDTEVKCSKRQQKMTGFLVDVLPFVDGLPDGFTGSLVVGFVGVLEEDLSAVLVRTEARGVVPLSATLALAARKYDRPD